MERRVVVRKTAGRDALRDLEDRLKKVEGLIRSLQSGILPFGTKIVLGGADGGVEVTVTDTGGGGKDVTFYNPANATSYVINL